MDKKFESLTVEGKDLKAGDVLTKGEIGKVMVKQAWTHFTYMSGETGKYRNDEAVFIRRETEESKGARIEAEHRARRNKLIREWFGTYQERSRTKAVQAKINDQLNRDGGLVDDWTVSQLLTAQAEDKVSARVHRAIRVFDEKGADHPASDLVEVVELVAERFRNELISGMRGGMSRSTSIVHNAMEDADRAAQAGFLDGGSFGSWFM